MCLPENYHLKYYLYHGICWPHVLYVAELDDGRIVGYVLAKMDDDEEVVVGHITSLSVHRNYRKLGIAVKMMNQALEDMKNVYEAHHCGLNVRVSNYAAISLYRDVLGFLIHNEDVDYYADNENAYEMRKYFDPEEEAEARAEL